MEKIKQNDKKRQKIIFIVLGGLLGVLLLIFGGGMGKDKSEGTETATDGDIYSMASDYADMLEARVADICSGVEGAGETQVFVSLAGGYRTVYAYDSQSSSSGYKSELVMSGSGSDKKAVIAAYEYPEISGVGIVCRGGDNPRVQSQIISLVSAALDIPTNKIYVAGGK